ncbi:MAG: SMI1/KNR4 family protein [Planctomycetota bacterium]|nr:SMI1/KNR4 family protein [Planctomycetota bacterium]
MRMSLERLLSAASDSSLPSWTNADADILERFGTLGGELHDLLARRNGFFAFESAIQVFPLGTRQDLMTLGRWNDHLLWRCEYSHLISDPILFFAQDIYGNQFGITTNSVVLFYSETAEIEVLSDSIAKWCVRLLSDWRGFSGFTLAHDWQTQNRAITEGERLIPRIPFVLGGKYTVANLYAGSAVAAMRFRGSLALQIAGIPDGTQIDLKIV